MTTSHPLLAAIEARDIDATKTWLDTYGAPIINYSTNETSTNIIDPRVVNTYFNYGLYHYALEWLPLIDLLKQYKDIDIEHRDIAGRTALGTFFRSLPFPSYQSKVLTSLLEVGADVNAQDKYGYTPMHWLIENNDQYMNPGWFVEQLVRCGADTSIRNIYNQTSILIARLRSKEHWMCYN